MRIKTYVAVGAVLLAAGCGGGTTAVTHSPAPAQSPSASQTQPAQVSMTAEAIAHRMGLSGVVAYTATTDPNHLLGKQGEYMSKSSWAGYANDSASGGGSIEVFANSSDMQARLSYLKGFQPPIGDGYDYTAGNAILRLSPDYTPARAQSLHTSFHRVVAQS